MSFSHSKHWRPSQLHLLCATLGLHHKPAVPLGPISGNGVTTQPVTWYGLWEHPRFSPLPYSPYPVAQCIWSIVFLPDLSIPSLHCFQTSIWSLTSDLYLQCCRVMVNVTQSLPSVKCCPSSPRHTANLSAQYSRSSLLLKVLTCLLPGPNMCSSIQLYSASRCFLTAPLTPLWHLPSSGSPFLFLPPFRLSFLSLPYFFTQHYGVHSASVGEKRC